VGIGSGREPFLGRNGRGRLLVIDPALSVLQQLGEGLRRAAPDFLHPRFELAPLLALDGEDVAGGIDPAAIAIGP
jgi:hypothetical protein